MEMRPRESVAAITLPEGSGITHVKTLGPSTNGRDPAAILIAGFTVGTPSSGPVTSSRPPKLKNDPIALVSDDATFFAIRPTAVGLVGSEWVQRFD